VPAIVIAFLCAIESLLSATVASGMTGTTFNPNQELVGQGVANVFSSLLGGLPATGAIARTAASIENGAKSSLAGVFHAVFVMALYFLLMGVVKFIPLAVFSAKRISQLCALPNVRVLDTGILFPENAPEIHVRVNCALTGGT
jgi:SulP family sulfate permease